MPNASRREQILQALAAMLETQPGSRITTSALAAAVGVSEAALYRHFPSKAKMLEGLIEFIEESLFPRIKRAQEEESTVARQCAAVLQLLLVFAERNPGFARLLVGDALQGEDERLRTRIRQLFDRIETELRSIVRAWASQQVPAPELSAAQTANLLLATVEGRINQFVRSEFSVAPTKEWDAQWRVLERALF